MANLSTEDRQRVWRTLMRYWSNLREAVDGPKSELLTTVNETDGWIEDNQVSYNSALTYGTNYTPLQKTLLFCAVALMRVDPGAAAFLRRALGQEVD